MNTAVGLAIIGALVLILLWQKSSPPPAVADKPDPAPVVVVDEQPVYIYPTTYTSSPWRIPAYSYGSTYAYRRFHQPYVPRAWRSGPWRSGPGPMMHMRPMHMRPMRSGLTMERPSAPPPHASPVPRIAMSHPMPTPGPRSPMPSQSLMLTRSPIPRVAMRM